ncbi:MAG: amidohydrolase family protein, partial [Gammaproteobacteria bacterium]|nr:amidohydrolase family protein [Gammaproteobacteria bacterium]
KLRQLHAAGGNFILASDSGTRGNPHFAAAWREMYFLVREVGLTEMEAIMAGTSEAARILRQRDLGAIAEGKLADIIVVDGDPLMDIGAMRNVARVIKDGRVVR